MSKRVVSILIITIISSFSLYSQTSYKIIDTYYGWDVPMNELMDKVVAANVVLIGEQHDDSIAHVFQLDVLHSATGRLSAKKVILSMEMFERDVQGVMDEYLNGWISEKNFIKESRAWNNYSDYKPLVEFCKELGIPVVCANTPSRYVNMVTRLGFNSLKDLPHETKINYLPSLPVDTLKGAYHEKFWSVMGDAAHASPKMRYLYQSQNLWDATMAQSIRQALFSRPQHTLIHINGRFHSDEDLGLTHRIKKLYKRKGQVITISCVTESEYKSQEMKDLADYVILTR